MGNSIRIEICIDANNLENLADFWCLALNYKRHDSGGETYLNLVPKKPQKGPVIFLQKVNKVKRVKDRIHLDIYSSDPELLVKRLIKSGAKLSGDRFHDKDFWWQVMQDPEGNEFCVMPETDDTKPNLVNVV